jgi:hypothetical protein
MGHAVGAAIKNAGGDSLSKAAMTKQQPTSGSLRQKQKA